MAKHLGSSLQNYDWYEVLSWVAWEWNLKAYSTVFKLFHDAGSILYYVAWESSAYSCWIKLPLPFNYLAEIFDVVESLMDVFI